MERVRAGPSRSSKRKLEIVARKQKNGREQEAALAARRALQGGNNPWERIMTLCDIKEGGYLGQKDVSRLKQAILSRQSDFPH